MPRTVWIVDKHACPPKYETHFRYFKYAQYLKEKGFNVKVFISSFLHRQKIDLIEDKTSYKVAQHDGIDYVYVKTLPYKTNGLRRIYSLYQFTRKVIFYLRKNSKPDAIIHASNAPFSNGLGKYATKRKIKYVAEILDLWPESFVTFGIISSKSILLKLAYRMERKLYTRSDNVVFSMEGGPDYIVDKKWDQQRHRGNIDMEKILYINNSVDLDDFNSTLEENKFKAEYLDNNYFNVIYIGSISLANDVQKLIEAAEYLNQNPKIRFYIYGDGSERDKIDKYCKDRNLNNVFLKDKWIEYKYVPSLLSQSSLNILNFKQSDSEKYGGSQGKLFNYIASGKPICSNIKMGYCLINKHKLGIANFFESSSEYAEAILTLSEMSESDYSDMCQRVKSVAKEYDFKIQSKKLLDII